MVDKKVRTLFGEQSKAAVTDRLQLLRDHGFGEWKPQVGEKLLRVTHTAAFLTALLSRENQKVFWMSDHDAICSTPEVQNRTLTLFARLIDLYARHKLEMAGGATPFEGHSTDLIDLLSVADLVAGSLAHFLPRRDAAGVEQDNIAVKSGADTVLKWLGHQGVGMKKMTVLVRLNAAGNLECVEFGTRVTAGRLCDKVGAGRGVY